MICNSILGHQTINRKGYDLLNLLSVITNSSSLGVVMPVYKYWGTNIQYVGNGCHILTPDT